MQFFGDRTPVTNAKRPRSLTIEVKRPISKGLSGTQTARFPAIDTILLTLDAIVDPKGQPKQS